MTHKRYFLCLVLLASLKSLILLELSESIWLLIFVLLDFRQLNLGRLMFYWLFFVLLLFLSFLTRRLSHGLLFFKTLNIW